MVLNSSLLLDLAIKFLPLILRKACVLGMSCSSLYLSMFCLLQFNSFCRCKFFIWIQIYENFLSLIYTCRVDRNKYQIQIPLPPKIDPSVTMMTVEEKPDVTYNDVGGCKEQIEKMREVC